MVFAEVLRSIASLLWPILGFAFLFFFRREIAGIMVRIRRGKLLGQEIELDKELSELQANLAEADIVSSFAIAVDEKQADSDMDDVIKSVLDSAKSSPKIALMKISSELERRVRHILGSSGQAVPDVRSSLQAMTAEIASRYGVPRFFESSLRMFMDIRNKIIHGGEVKEEDVIRAIDVGITLFKIVDLMPVETNIVYHPGVDIYSDSECKNLIDQGKGIMLETISPGGAVKNIRIYPSTQTHFRKERG